MCRWRPSTFLAAALGLLGSLAWSLTPAAAQPPPAASPQLGPWQGGTATSYEALARGVQQGACGYGQQADSDAWPGALRAALPPALTAGLPQSGCGACLAVECGSGEAADAAAGCLVGPGGNRTSVTVTVTETCPSCAPGTLALHPQATAALAASGTNHSNLPVRFRQVPCRPSGNIELVVDHYSLAGAGWLRLHLESLGGSGGVTSLWLRATQGGGAGEASAQQAGLSPRWRALTNVNSTALWELSGVPQPPLDLLAYPAGGLPLLARAVIPTAGATGYFPTNLQANLQGSLSLPASPGGSGPGVQLPAAEPAAKVAAALIAGVTPAAELAPPAAKALGAAPAAEMPPATELPPALISATAPSGQRPAAEAAGPAAEGARPAVGEAAADALKAAIQPALASALAAELAQQAAGAASPAAESQPPASEAAVALPPPATSAPADAPAGPQPQAGVAAAAPSDGSGGGAPIGAIVGGAVGGAALVLALAGLLGCQLARARRGDGPPASASPSGSAGDKGKSDSTDADAEAVPYGGGGGGGAPAYRAHQLSPDAAAMGWAGSAGGAYAAPGAYTPAQQLSAGTALPGSNSRPPLPPSAGAYQQPSRLGVDSRADLLSTHGSQLMFPFEGGPASYRASDQLLDSLMSTFDDAPPSLPAHQRLAWLAPQPPPGGVHASQAPQPYGSLPQQLHPLAASMPRMPAGGGGYRPSTSIDYVAGGHGAAGFGVHGSYGASIYGLAAAGPLPARPATSGAVYRSTAEWGRMSAAERDAAQRSLMATLREDELFEAPSEQGSTAASAAALARARQPPSPAVSLDSYRSALQPGGAAWQPAHTPAAASLLLGEEAAGVPAWWGAESPRRAATAGASGWVPGGDPSASPGTPPYPGDMLTSPGGNLETASLTPHQGAGASAGGAWAPPADSLASGSPSGSSASGPFAVGRPGIEASPPPPGAVPFSIKHSGVAAPQRGRLPTAGADNAFSGAAAAYRRSAPLEGFTLSPDSFSSQPSPALLTRGSQSASPPPADPTAQPSRFAEARRAAAAAQQAGDESC